MKITGKITVTASEAGLLTARRTSRQAMAKVALTSRASVAPALRDGADGGGGTGAAVGWTVRWSCDGLLGGWRRSST